MRHLAENYPHYPIAEMDRRKALHIDSRFIFDDNPDAAFILSPAGQILQANLPAVQRYGYRLDELLQMNISVLAAPHLKQAVPPRLQKSLASCEQFEWRHQRRDGSELPVEIYAHPILYQGEPAILASVRDISVHVRTEQTLRDRESQLRFIADHAPVMIAQCDDEKHYKFVNQPYAELFGLHPSDIVGKHPREILGEEAYVFAAPHMDAALAGQAVSYDLELPATPNDIKSVTVNYVPERDQSGVVVGFIAAITDITARKQAEMGVKNAVVKYQNLFDSIGDSIFIIGMDGRFIQVNQSACENLGYSQEELLKMGPADIDTPEYAAKVSERIKELKEKGSLVFESAHIRKDGIVIPIELSIKVITFDAKPALIAVARDITERKQSEDYLSLERAKLNSVLENMQSGVFFFDAKGEHCWMNPEALRIHGFSSAADMLERFSQYAQEWELSDPTGRILPLEEWPGSRAFRGEHYQNYEVQLRHLKSGQTTDVLYSCAEVRDISGHIERWVFTILDITKRKLAEAALEKSQKLLAETEQIGHVGGWEFHTDTKMLTWTEEVYRIHEVAPGYELNVGGGIDFYTPESKPTIEQAVRRAVEYGEPYNVELEIITAKGNLRSVHAIGKADLEHRRVYGFFQDITERKQAEAELRIAAIAFESQEGMLVTDADGNILRVNNAFTEITGYSANEVIGKNPRILHSGRQNTKFYEEMWTTLSQTGAWKGEIWNRRKNGEIYPENLTITAVKNSNGTVANYVATLADITMSRAASEEIQRLAFYDGRFQIPTATVNVW